MISRFGQEHDERYSQFNHVNIYHKIVGTSLSKKKRQTLATNLNTHKSRFIAMIGFFFDRGAYVDTFYLFLG